MVRFPCFPSSYYNHKSKRSLPHTMGKTKMDSQVPLSDQTTNHSTSSLGSNSTHLTMSKSNPSETSMEQVVSMSSFDCCKSEEMNHESCPSDKREICNGFLRKSQSLGSGLDREVVNLEEDVETVDINSSLAVNTDPENHTSAFSIGDLNHSDGEAREEVDFQLFNGPVDDSVCHTTPDLSLPRMTKSFSCSNLYVSVRADSLDQEFKLTRSKSFHGLSSTIGWKREHVISRDGCSTPRKSKSTSSCHDMLYTSQVFSKSEDCALSNPSGGSFEIADREQYNMFEIGKDKFHSHCDDEYNSCHFPNLLDGGIPNEIEESGPGNYHEAETSDPKWDTSFHKHYDMKRIEEWVSEIDLEDSIPVPELGESSKSASTKDVQLINNGIIAKVDSRFSYDIEANKYISALAPSSSLAQMANLGLTAVPFLGAFVSLRVLNLSGNAIVRINAGMLPRGLHVLNLSKNYISAIEGLRELSRLRVLDVSYNRICRIGHGLAYCPSLKELYVTGNKVSEVEGLHRLLKLNILDLGFNKISTTKCLGQLAANYNSLQAINLDGNPAQRNVGDDQLKKYLQSLLPLLLYFNKQKIRSSSSKDISERSSRSITAYPHDRTGRSDHKHSRRGNHGGATHRVASSSGNGRSGLGVISPKLSKGRHGRLPPAGTRGTHHHHPTSSSTLLSHPSHNMRRSQSAGTLLVA
ncbi:hypothetical protein H6P81_005717 [Aristolochia fimbriata]|uniref:Uncharacterized protein n=1 Tax=Aristolochia fimbriata TaxID=158543 RepID=A0AAV7EVE6_ARIFI|nr:hypothetical protein H6P81_005717 [Aristolochia fimbriata]